MIAEKIRVGLIEDHKIFRQAVRNYLMNLQSGTQIIVDFEASDGQEAIEKMERSDVDVIVMDLFMSETDSLQLVKKLKSIKPEQKILVLSMCTDLLIISRLIENGIDGYISKAEDIELLPQAIIALNKKVSFPTKLMTEALYFSNGNHHTNIKFTPREIQIISLLWEGHNNKQIADLLNLGTRSVEKYISDMKAKVDVSSQISLMRYCIQHKIIM